MNEYDAKQAYANQAIAGQAIMSVHDEMTLTPRENIKRRIESLRKEIKRLEETENNLESSNLLDVPIMQLRQAMQF